MANNIEFKVLADLKDFEDSFKKVNDVVGKVGKAAVISFAAASGAIALVTAAAKESQRVMNQTEAVIRSTGGAAGVTAKQVSDLAKEFENLTTFSDESIQSAENVLLTFNKVGGDILPQATKAVLNMSAALGIDLENSARQVGKALNDPIESLGALSRVGVKFNSQQEAQIKLLVNNGQVAKAQSLIMDELSTKFDGSAEASRKGLGAIDGLKNSLDNLGEAVGLSIAPLIERLAKGINTLVKAFESNSGMVAFLGILLLVVAGVSGLLVVIAGVVGAITTLGGIASIVIAGIALAVTALITAFSSVKTESVSLNESLNGKTGAFSTTQASLAGINSMLETVKARMADLSQESFILGPALSAAFGAGTGGGATTALSTVNVTAAAPPAFLVGFNEGLDNIKAKIYDLKQAGMDFAGTLQNGMAAAFSDIILGAKTAKEAFAAFGQQMLKALVDFIAQWLAFQIISKTAMAASSIFGVALATTLAAAYLPAAVFASIATFGAADAAASEGIASTFALANFLALPKFAQGSGGVKDDTLAMINKREIIVPATFSDSIRKGDLSLSGNSAQGGESDAIIFDFSNAQFNGITQEFVKDIFTRASEAIANKTLAFRGVQ